MIFVLDTSALLCFLKKEIGWEKIGELFQEKVFMSAVNIAEYYTWCSRENYDLNYAENILNQLEIETIDFNYNQSKETGILISKTYRYGLSLGDRSCLALGKQLKAKIYTCDKVWEKLAGNFEVEVVR